MSKSLLADDIQYAYFPFMVASDETEAFNMFLLARSGRIVQIDYCETGVNVLYVPTEDELKALREQLEAYEE